MVKEFPRSSKERERERTTNLTGDGVVDVKTRNSADTGPCRHRHHEKEKEPRIRSGKGEEGRQGIYRAYMKIRVS